MYSVGSPSNANPVCEPMFPVVSQIRKHNTQENGPRGCWYRNRSEVEVDVVVRADVEHTKQQIGDCDESNQCDEVGSGISNEVPAQSFAKAIADEFKQQENGGGIKDPIAKPQFPRGDGLVRNGCSKKLDHSGLPAELAQAVKLFENYLIECGIDHKY